MRIFMLVSRVPWPLEKGDKLRAFHQLKMLAEDGKMRGTDVADTRVLGRILYFYLSVPWARRRWLSPGTVGKTIFVDSWFIV